MRTGISRRVLPAAAGVVVVALAVAAFLAGRLTAPAPGSGTASSAASSAGSGGGYAAGFSAGEALGVGEGRALQQSASLAPGAQQSARQTFAAGYAAGAEDVFGGYDGGWAMGAPYLIVLAPGNGGATYRIASRIPVQPHVNYSLCSNGHDICQH
jgi:hypothetical protein